MSGKIFDLPIRAAWFRKKTFLYQTLIIMLLCAVITGSLLTGYSVRESLRRSATLKLGNAGILISSGERYIDSSLAGRLSSATGTNSTGFLELKGYIQNLATQKKALSTNIFAVGNDFFSFNGADSLKIGSGEVFINKKLAHYLNVSEGDELIIHYKEISDVPAGAPFAPSEETDKMFVKKIAGILEAKDAGNFSLSISQIEPFNIFLSLADIDKNGNKVLINKLILQRSGNLNAGQITSTLRKILEPEDIGLRLRTVSRTGEAEIVSDRIFIDQKIIETVKKAVPVSSGVLTYLGNSFTKGSRSAPYSFISAIPATLYPYAPSGNFIIINDWLAKDLSASAGDTILLSWYAPDSLNNLAEKNEKFIISGIAGQEAIWTDSLLMPAFPGIVDSKSCSDWDAGILINLGKIRQKDEKYWERYRGTPKAFINYEKGKDIWGNNFGPATSLRFTAGMAVQEIRNGLKNKIEPSEAGISISDIYDDSLKAANESVDFGSLFLSLGFFLIGASLILLTFVISSYLDSKSGEIRTLYALGFKNKFIGRLIFQELSVMAVPGSISGAFGGYVINIIITIALNSVWQGAVQTDTLNSFFSIGTVFSGFLITIIPVIAISGIKVRGFLKSTDSREGKIFIHPGRKKNALPVIISALLTTGIFLFSLMLPGQKVALSFMSGSLMFITLILVFRYIVLISGSGGKRKKEFSSSPSILYYGFYPAHALTPVLFIAAGLFAVFITGANRINFDKSQLSASGGTGGYLFWCETSLPVMENLNTVAGRNSAGLDDTRMKDVTFVQVKKSAGNDASCLNLNHVTMPPILGLDPSEFIKKGSFTFASILKVPVVDNGWQFLNFPAGNNIVYGVADQTVLEWGLKTKIGDTIVVRTESGEKLKIIIAGGLKSSVFQGNVIIGINSFNKFFPSVSGSTIILADGKQELTDSYRSLLSERLENKGINAVFTGDRLASFNEVTNTYLSVFMVLGGLGMITGIVGLGFILMRNYNLRRREFSLMIATGFTIGRIRKIIIAEQLAILAAGLSTGFISAIMATLPTVSDSGDMPWGLLLIMISAIALTGLSALFVSARYVTSTSLTSSLRKE